MRRIHIIFASAVIAGSALCSCDEYTDELQAIGHRVEVLEDSVLAVQNTLETLNKLMEAMNTRGVVTNIKKNSDGSVTLEFLDGREPITFVNGANGEDGREADVLLGVKKGTDGVLYWVFNDQWILDENGNRISAEPKDGKNGADGKDADPVSGDVILPQARINETTGNWEISVDGGVTWDSTGVPANGKNGKDGVKDPYIVQVWVDGNFIILIVRVGTEEVTVRLTKV